MASADDSPATIKAVLRRRLRRQLTNIDPPVAQRAAEQATEHLLRLPEVARAKSILSCLSFGVEIDTWDLVERLRVAGKRLYVPRVERRNPRLFIHSYPCELKTTSYGLRQPAVDSPKLTEEAVAAEIDVVLVLGLAFDHQGFRLGYGGGYFDRFLGRNGLPAIGLAFHQQMLPSVPRESHDVAMHAVVTEQGVWRV